MKSFGSLSFPSCLLCHPAWTLAGRGGKTSLLQGWKQVLLAPQLTPEFLLFTGAVRIHPTEEEQEKSVLALPRVNKRKSQSQNVTGLQRQAPSKDSPTFTRISGISVIPDIFTYIITRASHINIIYVFFLWLQQRIQKKLKLKKNLMKTYNLFELQIEKKKHPKMIQ